MQEFNLFKNWFKKIISHISYNVIVTANNNKEQLLSRQKEQYFSLYRNKIVDILLQNEKNLKLVHTITDIEKKKELIQKTLVLSEEIKTLDDNRSIQNISHNLWKLQFKVDEIRFLIGDKQWKM